MLKLSIGKTSFMMVRSQRNNRPVNVNIFIGGRRIKEENEIKMLGVTFDAGLTFATHLRELIRNVKYCLRAFTRATKYIGHDTAKILYNSVIASRLNYGDAIWSPPGVTMQRKLQVIQNIAARKIMRVNSRHPS